MKKNETLLSNERSDVHTVDIISQIVDMKKEDILKVLTYREKELRKYAPHLYELIDDINTLHDLKMDREREELFYQVEKDVLAQIHKDAKNKITGRYASLQKAYAKNASEYNADHDKAYRELIVMIHNKEIIMTSEEVIFTGAKIAVQSKELQFLSKSGCKPKSYKGFDGKPITRHEMDAKAFEESDEYHKRFMETFNSVKDTGLHILTKDDIKKITAAYSGWEYKRLSTFLYCISGPGTFILDSKTHTEYHGFGDYEYGEESVPTLSFSEDGTYYESIRKAYDYGKTNNIIGSFLLARDI